MSGRNTYHLKCEKVLAIIMLETINIAQLKMAIFRAVPSASATNAGSMTFLATEMKAATALAVPWDLIICAVSRYTSESPYARHPLVPASDGSTNEMNETTPKTRYTTSAKK